MAWFPRWRGRTLHRSLPEVMMEQVFNLTGDLGIGSDPVALQRKCGLFWPMSDITLKACELEADSIIVIFSLHFINPI